MIKNFVKKRVIIAVLFTLAVIFVTNKYWLIFEPLPVELNVLGVGNCAITTIFNKEDNDDFDRTKSGIAKVNLSETSKVNINVTRAKQPKRLRILISNAKRTSPLTITSVNIKNGQFKIDDFSKMQVSGAYVLKATKSELKIQPADINVVLTYPETLSVNADTYFDYKLFVIIVVLMYLLAYKLANYVADFKTIKGKSRIDIVFLTIFFVFLFVPMSYINNEDISLQENRTFTQWEPFILNNKINFNFGKNFNKWFNDRFYLRQDFIYFYNAISMALTDKTDRGTYDRKTGFYYYGRGWQGVKDVDKDMQALKEFSDFWDKRNVKLYVLIVPNKANIYPSNILYDSENEHKKFLQYINQQKKNLRIIYPYDELINAKKDNLIFFKTDHHWTDDGAFVAYKALMNEIVKDYKNVRILNENDFNYTYNELIRSDFNRDFSYGTTGNAIGLNNLESHHNIPYRYYVHKNYNHLLQDWTQTEGCSQKNYYYPEGADLRVIQLGTSHNENLTEFIPFTFKDVLRIRNNTVKGIPQSEEFKIMKYYAKDMVAYNPDIIILCIASDNIQQLHDLFNME